jgi:citrate synthase
MRRLTTVSDSLEHIAFLNKHRGVIRSNKGGWIIGQGISNQGYSMLEDLVGKVSFFQVLVLNSTGRLLDERITQWIESAFICLSWPDPRIWCNQIGALGGDARISPVAAVCAGTLAGNSRMYGPGTLSKIIPFLISAMQAVSAKESVQSFIEGRAKIKGRLVIPGFARPIATGDERVAAMQAVADQLDFEIGPHLEIAYAIESYLQQQYGESLNLAGYICGFLLDQGFTLEDVCLVLSLCINGGIYACYAEYRDKSAGSFLPLRCDDIDYTGVQERPVPCA